MIPWNTFARGAVFAAVAAACWLPWALTVAPVVGAWHARALYLIAVATVYVAGLSRDRVLAIPAALLVVVIGIAAALMVRTTTELALILAMALGFARSGVLYRAAPARAVAMETLMLAGGLLFARFLGGYTLISNGLAIWGFLLVQSVFFLIGGVQARPLVQGTDAFEDAHRRAMILLDRSGV